MSYGCDLQRLRPELAERFVELAEDDAARRFRAAPTTHGRLRTWAQRALGHFMSDFDANGWLGMYPMHLLSTAQWGCLLGAAGGALVDVGAGNGDVTAGLAPLFDSVTTTELSAPMARRLRRRGFSCERVDVAETGVPGGPWDTIACLNVLDRSARPHTLLERLRDGLAPGGRLILAVVLPYSPFVYEGGATVPPIEKLDCEAADWESSVDRLAARVLEPLGLHVQRLARAPYLSGGDADAPLYALDDAILVCARAA